MAQRMPSADAAWLHMDQPTNLMVINAVMWFEDEVSLDDLRDVCRERLVARYPRFRQRVTEGGPPGAGPRWEDDEHFDIDNHLHHLALPAPHDRSALQALVSDLVAVPLDRSKPLWHLYLIDGFEGGSAVLVRMHHCIADGIALARVLLSLTDGAPDAGIAPPREERSAGGPLWPLSAIARPAVDLAHTALRVADAALQGGIDLLTHPSEGLRLAEVAARDAATLARLTAQPPDAKTALKGELGVPKLVTWTRPIPLGGVKEIGRATGTTVNDVLLTAVTGALGRYLRARGTPADVIRAMVPFNLRPLDQPLPRDLGNKFGLVFLPLPVGMRGRKARLREVKRRMDEIKASPEGAIAYAVLEAVGVTPAQVERVVVDLFSAKGTAVMTNVPGPREPVTLAGTQVRGVLVWAPTSGSLAMSVSIFSYAGEVTVGLLVDAGLVPDPERIVRGIEREYEALRKLVVPAR